MKIVKLIIEVEVPDNTKQVSVDSNGEIYAHFTDAHPYTPPYSEDDGFWVSSDRSIKLRCNNWRKTLTEVKNETEKALEEHRNGKWVLYGSGGRTTEKALEEHRNGKWVLYDDVEEYLLGDDDNG